MVMAMAVISMVMLGSSPTQAANVGVTMRPLRYCSDKRWWGCKTRSYPYGGYWNNNGMSTDNQNKAFFATMGSVPSRSNVQYIAIFSSGQQGSSGGDDVRNAISGATDNWKWNTDENGSEPRSVRDGSVAERFYNDQTRFLPRSKTLYLSIWDPQFNHMASSGEKTDTLNGYADYLNSKVYWSNIKGVVIAGSSRGGCLAMRLSQHLRTRFNLGSNTKFAVASVDGVCKYTQSELGTTSSTMDNPVHSGSWKVYKTDMNGQFPSSVRDRYCILHLAGGEEVTGVALGVRAFGHSGSACGSTGGCTLTHNGNVWYKQTWNTLCHTCAGRDISNSAIIRDPILNHFESCKNRFGWN